jgi:Flp pilus assembly protein TadG
MTSRLSVRNRRRRQAGQSMLEFALSASIVFTLIISTMNIGYAIFCYHSVAYAARAAVRYAVVRGPSTAHPATNAEIQQVAIASAPGVNLSTNNVNVTWPADTRLTTMKDAVVTITMPYQIYMPPMSLNLTSTSQMLASR